jgi:hypothetical protein
MTSLGSTSTTIAAGPVICALEETVLTGMTGILFLQRFIVTFSQVREGRPLENCIATTQNPQHPFFLGPSLRPELESNQLKGGRYDAQIYAVSCGCIL